MKKNILITFGFMNENDFWSDSIQITLFLYMLLKQNENYEISLFNLGIPVDNISNNIIKNILKDLTIIEDKDYLVYNKIDLIIESNVTLTEKIGNYLKKRDTKIILNRIGNSYYLDVEEMIYNKKETPILNKYYDSIWANISDSLNVNKFYLRYLYDKKIEVVPFIWSNFFIDKFNCEYKPKESEGKNILIAENNSDINNMCLFPLLILEKINKENPNLINKVNVLNSYKFSENKRFLSFVEQLTLSNDDKISFVDNYNRYLFLNEETDIIISHKLDDKTINNFYMEALYKNYPLIHNSNLLKNVGYYYNNNDINDAYDKFLKVIKIHDKNIKIYKNDFNKMLNIYNIDNKNIQKIYFDNIDKIFD